MDFRFTNCTERVATILMGFAEECGLGVKKEYMGREKGYDVEIKCYEDIITFKFYNGSYMIPTTQVLCKEKIILIPNNEYVSINII